MSNNMQKMITGKRTRVNSEVISARMEPDGWHYSAYVGGQLVAEGHVELQGRDGQTEALRLGHYRARLYRARIEDQKQQIEKEKNHE